MIMEAILNVINAIGWETLVTGIITVIAALAGGKWVKFKKKFREAIALASAVDEAWDDNKLTDAEKQKILEAWRAFKWWNQKEVDKARK